MTPSYVTFLIKLLFGLSLYRASAGAAWEHQTTNEAPPAHMVSVQPPRLAEQMGHTNSQGTARKHGTELGKVSETDENSRPGIHQDGLLKRQSQSNGTMQEEFQMRKHFVQTQTHHEGGSYMSKRDLNDRYLGEQDHNIKTSFRGAFLQEVIQTNVEDGAVPADAISTNSNSVYPTQQMGLNMDSIRGDIPTASAETKGQTLHSVSPWTNSTWLETGQSLVNSTRRVFVEIERKNNSAIIYRNESIAGGANNTGLYDSNSMNDNLLVKHLKMQGTRLTDEDLTNQIFIESKNKDATEKILQSDGQQFWQKRSAMDTSKKQEVKPYSITAKYINLFTHKSTGVERPAVHSTDRKDILRKMLSNERKDTFIHKSYFDNSSINTTDKTNNSANDFDEFRLTTGYLIATATPKTNTSDSEGKVMEKLIFPDAGFNSDAANKGNTNTSFPDFSMSHEGGSDHSMSGTKEYSTYKISNDSTISHLNLDRLEAELSLKENSQHDLLFAISILQHHSSPGFTTPRSDNSFRQTDESLEIDDLKHELMHSNEASVELDNELSQIHPIFPGKLNFMKSHQDDRTKSNSGTADTRSYESNLPNTMFIDGELGTEEGDHTKQSSLQENNKHLPIDLPSVAYSTSDIGFLPHDMLMDELVHGQHVSGEQEFRRRSTLVGVNEIRRSRPLITVSESNPEKNIKWFILVMDGDCGIISKRMNTFVMFLKAALSARLDAQYDDILVMSVFCDSTFMVNISLDTTRYTNALSQLQALADANTTLLEISGEIFYLEKIITQNSKGLLGRLGRSNDAEDVELVLYIAVGSVCAFILISVCIVTLISICRQEDTELSEVHVENVDKSEFPIRKPNVIYSHKFTQELNPEKYRLTPFEDSSHEGVSSSDSSSFDSAKGYSSDRGNPQTSSTDRCHDRKSHLNPSASKIQLLEEVQEEDEDEIEDCGVLEGDEDYHDEEDEVEEIDDEDDDFFIENMTRPLQENHLNHHQSHHTGRAHPISGTHHRMDCCHNDRSCKTASSTGPTNFDNPCYDR